MADRIIFHVDVNSAYLSWEAVRRLREDPESVDLRTIPSAVGGDRAQRRGVILAKSIPAKKYGVVTGEPVTDALKKCPQLELVLPDFELYRKNSAAVMEMMSRYSGRIEQFSIDEAFMDMTGMRGDPVATAHELKDRIREDLGFTVNIGISENKLLAKMASDFEKPDKVHTLWHREIPEKMWPLPVTDLLYIGEATRKKLADMGIHTIGEIARMDRRILQAHLKSHGLLIHDYANGIDDSPVETDRGNAPNKGYGHSTTTPFDVTDMQTARSYLLHLSEMVAARLREDRVKAGMVSVTIRNTEMETSSHQMSLPVATDVTAEIYGAACKCLSELWKGEPLRLLGVRTGRIKEEEPRQLTLFDDFDYEKHRRAEETMDELRSRFGSGAVIRARFAPPPEER